MSHALCRKRPGSTSVLNAAVDMWPFACQSQLRCGQLAARSPSLREVGLPVQLGRKTAFSPTGARGTRGTCCLNWERSSEPPQSAFVEEPTFRAVLMSGRTASHPKAPNHASAEVAAGFSPAILVAQTLIGSQCLVTRCTLGASIGAPAALAGNPL